MMVLVEQRLNSIAEERSLHGGKVAEHGDHEGNRWSEQHKK